MEVAGLAPWQDACSGSDTARPIPAVTTCKERTGHKLRRGDSASLPRAVWHRELPPTKTLMSLLLAGGAVGIEEVGAGLCQVPVEHLQHPLALTTGLQPQAEELLHLQGDMAWPEG